MTYNEAYPKSIINTSSVYSTISHQANMIITHQHQLQSPINLLLIPIKLQTFPVLLVRVRRAFRDGKYTKLCEVGVAGVEASFEGGAGVRG